MDGLLYDGFSFLKGGGKKKSPGDIMLIKHMKSLQTERRRDRPVNVTCLRIEVNQTESFQQHYHLIVKFNLRWDFLRWNVEDGLIRTWASVLECI